jgi:acetylcholinesterase
MLRLIGAAALLGSAFAQNGTLPQIDLGYEVYQAAGFNVCHRMGYKSFFQVRSLFLTRIVGHRKVLQLLKHSIRSTARRQLAVCSSSSSCRESPHCQQGQCIEVRTSSRDPEMTIPPPLVKIAIFSLHCVAVDMITFPYAYVHRICPQANPAWGLVASAFITSTLLGTPYNTSQIYTPPGAKSSSPVPQADPRESEDCLFLDVFVPEDVLVWIYGGGDTAGNKNNNPAGLIAASGTPSNGDVIYVAMNYRLGALGFQAGPTFNAEGGTSNAALYDQRFALEWVQKYIHLFGGDKNRVTVFGESAGGGSIMHQITAFGGLKGKAPFQQAVPQSPGWSPVQSNVQTENVYQRFLNLTNSKSLADLRALSSEAVMRANAQQVAYDADYGQFIYGPVVDGNFAPLQPGQLLAQGRFDKDVKIMVGHNANEGQYFTPPYTTSNEALQIQLKKAFPTTPQQSLDTISNTLYPAVFDGSYPYTDQYSRARLIISEGIFTCNTNYLSTALGNQSYSYLFAVPPAYHGQDVPYTYYTGGALSQSVINRTVAVALQEFITSFAEDGRPAADGVRQFNMYGPDAAVLELNITGIDEVRDSNANARCNWWQKALF